jgi:hypothetical protein
MTSSKLALKCPYCSWILEAIPPDRAHVAYSFDKPFKGSFYGEVLEQEFVCRNPECKKHFKIYWYSPLDYFNRI